MPENIDAVHELLMQDHHLTCREIEPSLGISPGNICTFDIADTVVKIIYSRWSLTSIRNLTIAQKIDLNWFKEMLEKYNGGDSKDQKSQVRNHGSMRIGPNQNNSSPRGPSNPSQIHRK